VRPVLLTAVAVLLCATLATSATAVDRGSALPIVPPREAGFRAEGLSEVDRIVQKAVADGAFPGAVLAVGRRGKLVRLEAFGRYTYEADAPRVTTDTVYDLASLTKVVLTTTVAMTLVDAGRLDLDAPVSSVVPGFRGNGKEKVRFRQLLTHSGGLLWWAPLYEELRGHEAYIHRILAMPLDYAPGTKTVYSDLGLILLGEALERLGGAPLDELGRQRVFEPLGMSDTRYRPPVALRPRIAPTENDPWRGRTLVGEVHDENAFALEGVAPHAGLFSSAGDLSRFAQMLLNGGTLEGHRVVSTRTVEAFTRRQGIEGSSRALGWDTPTDETARRSSTPGQPGYSSAGSLFSARSFGHTGFTGTSIWMDPERDLFTILLTNRVHPTRDNRAILKVRGHLADAVIRSLD